MNRFENRLHLGRECYSTTERRCNLFRENKLHLVDFSGEHPFFAPFGSKNAARQKQKHQARALRGRRKLIPDELRFIPIKNRLHPVAPLSARG
ncbi:MULTISPECIES: hypothetical protein [Pseudomonas]|uniref:hypothetical protein n=1 Tax=Pseudomonas TaxID=286 RepID=UPI0011DE40F9|nr:MULTISPECIES: hypothetical protein [Pseudomonas]MCB2254821.1 hypothetical protein [Pseudomonas chlororaphis]